MGAAFFMEFFAIEGRPGPTASKASSVRLTYKCIQASCLGRGDEAATAEEEAGNGSEPESAAPVFTLPELSIITLEITAPGHGRGEDSDLSAKQRREEDHGGPADHDQGEGWRTVDELKTNSIKKGVR